MKVLVFIMCVVVVVQSGPIGNEDSPSKVIIDNFVNCLNSDINLCLKEHVLRATERLRSLKKLDIFEGVTLYNNGAKESRSLDTLPADPEERNKQVTERLWSSASELLQKSDLELSYGGDDDESEAKSLNEVVESRGKKKKTLKKKLKILIPLAILGKIKAIVLVVAALLVIAASVFKIALLAKIAFIAKVIAIIKALIAKKHLHQEHSYTVPYEEHGHPVEHGWEGGWSRSKNEGSGLAYSAYKP